MAQKQRKRGHGSARSGRVAALAQQHLHQLQRRGGHAGPGAKDRGHARLVQRGVVLQGGGWGGQAGCGRYAVDALSRRSSTSSFLRKKACEGEGEGDGAEGCAASPCPG